MEWGWRTRPRLDTICSQIKSPVPGMGFFFWNRGWKAQGAALGKPEFVLWTEIRVYRM